MSEWINVEDRLPEKFSKVLILYHPYNKPENGFSYAACTVNEYHEFLSDEADEFIEFAMYWQQLPEPPQ